MTQEFILVGGEYVCDETSFDQNSTMTTNRLLGLFADEGMTAPYTPSLTKMTQKAIDLLSRNPNGFFLMIEAGQIDWAGHANNAQKVLDDTLELDEAVKIVLAFADRDKETLVIVTADHETGGMEFSTESTGLADEDGPFQSNDGQPFYINWSTTGHTGSRVPINSQGPGSLALKGRIDNTDIYVAMRDAFF